MFAAVERGPAKNHTINPTSGRRITSRLQRTLLPVDALDPMIETMAQMSSTRRIKPPKLVTFIPTIFLLQLNKLGWLPFHTISTLIHADCSSFYRINFDDFYLLSAPFQRCIMKFENLGFVGVCLPDEGNITKQSVYKSKSASARSSENLDVESCTRKTAAIKSTFSGIATTKSEAVCTDFTLIASWLNFRSGVRSQRIFQEPSEHPKLAIDGQWPN